MECTDLCMITFINDNQYSCLANWRLLKKIPSPSVALFTTFHQAWVRQLPGFLLPLFPEQNLWGYSGTVFLSPNQQCQRSELKATQCTDPNHRKSPTGFILS